MLAAQPQRSATMPSASQTAESPLEARQEVRAGRPDSLASLQPARSAWPRGVPGVLVHRRKGADKRRLRSRCALRRSPPLAPCARVPNSLVSLRARAGCRRFDLGCHRTREGLPSPLPSPPRSTPPCCSPPPSPPPSSPPPLLGPSFGARSPLLGVLRASGGSCPARAAAFAALALAPSSPRGAPHRPPAGLQWAWSSIMDRVQSPGPANARRLGAWHAPCSHICLECTLQARAVCMHLAYICLRSHRMWLAIMCTYRVRSRPPPATRDPVRSSSCASKKRQNGAFGTVRL